MIARLPAVAVYPKSIPDYAGAAAKGGAVVVTVGQEVENRTNRRVTLIGK